MAFWGTSKLSRVPYRLPRLLGSLSLAWVSLATPGFAEDQPLDAGSQACQECHGIPDWTINDPVADRQMNLSIDTSRYVGSSHGSVACRVCHEWGYQEIPHRGTSDYLLYLCVDCHWEEDSQLAHFRFRQRKKDLQRSVHGRAAVDPIDCHDCHDPHLFRPVNESDDALSRIAGSNAICLECHGPGRADENDFAQEHEAFPSWDNHLRKVKCVACHAADTTTTYHDVGAKDTSLRGCTECHTPGSAILQAVYEPRASPGPEPDSAGDAYVIGSSRSPGLERLSVIGFALTGIAIVVHGLARALSSILTGRRDDG